MDLLWQSSLSEAYLIHKAISQLQRGFFTEGNNYSTYHYNCQATQIAFPIILTNELQDGEEQYGL